MWSDMEIFVKAVYPALIVLRLADSKQPGMDRLHFYVRRLERTLNISKNHLNSLNINYQLNAKKDVNYNMLSYFLNTNATESSNYHNEFQNVIGNNDEHDEYSDCSDEQNIIDDNVAMDDKSDDEISYYSNSDDDNKRLGNKMFSFFLNRKKNLVYDLSIAGWMVSPLPDVIKDAATHVGSDRDAVERLLKKWYGTEVSSNYIFYFFIYLFIYL